MNFELRYIHPVWQNKDQVSYIDVSPSPIEVEYIGNSTFSANTLAFIRINENEDAYIGIKLLSDVKYDPFVEKADGSIENLIPIRQTDGDIWWIIANSWSRADKEYRTQAFNRMGKITVRIGNNKLILTNEANNFTYDDLEYILNDFKSNLWQIVVDPKSLTSTNIQQSVPIFSSTNSIADLKKFLTYLEKLLKNPQKKVIETTEIKCKEKANVIKSTFQELLKNPFARKVSSRSFSESFDTPENKYMHFCLNRIIYILKIYKKISAEKQKFITETLEKLENYKINYLNNDYGTLQKEVLRNQIEMLEKQYRELGKKLTDARKIPDWQSQLAFKIGKYWNNSKDRCFIDAQILYPISFKYDYVALDLPLQWKDKLSELSEEFIKKLTFVVTAEVKYEPYTSQFSNKVGLIFKFYNITNVSIDSRELSGLKDYKNQNSIHEYDDFVRREKIISKNNISNLEKQRKDLASTDLQIEPLLKKAQNLSRNFEKKKIGTQNNYPQSVLFVTNNLYSAPYNFYRKISKNLGITERVINQLEQIEKIGLIKINEIYEFWSLISIIKVLVEKLKFKPDENWAEKIIDSIFSRGKNSSISFRFVHDAISFHFFNEGNFVYDSIMKPIKLHLTYQKLLRTGRRPDFFLEIEKDAEQNANYIPLILDAKFRGNVTSEVIEKDIYDMYEGRKYGDSGSVFILHTSCKAMFDENNVFKSLSPLSWGNFSSYGGEDKIDHKKGHIFLLPSPKYPYSLDNLQRLIGAFLQQNSELDASENSEGLYPNLILTKTNNLVCIGCGSNDLNIEVGKTQSQNNKYRITCNSCGLRSERTFCFCCRRQNLYKNGPWWTYHMTKATQVSNVVCPKCGAYF